MNELERQAAKERVMKMREGAVLRGFCHSFDLRPRVKDGKCIVDLVPMTGSPGEAQVEQPASQDQSQSGSFVLRVRGYNLKIRT
jgi:hypothetical protein